MYQKYYFQYGNNLGSYLNYYKQRLKRYKKLKFVMLFSKKDFLDLEFDEIKRILSNVFKENIKPNQIVISIEGKSNFTKREWEKVEEFYSFFNSKNIEFGFEDLNRTFTPFEILNARKQINDMAKKFQNKNLSPFEKLVGVYSLVTQRQYIAENSEEHWSQSRSIYGVLNSDRMVCVGYSSLIKEIMKKLEKNNIIVFSNNVGCSKDNKTLCALHRNLIVYCKDEKYNIEGYYYLDPTWDRSIDKDFPSFNFFMVPLNEIENIEKNGNKIKSLDLTFKRPQIKNKNNKEDDDKIFYGKYDKKIEFTSDNFQYNKKFLLHFLSNYEDAFNVLKDLMISEDLFDEDNYDLMYVSEPLKEITIPHMVDVIEKSIPMQKLTDMLVKEKSNSVDFNNTMIAYSNVLKKLELGFTEKEISKIINLTTNYNLELIKENFNSGSNVSLMEHLRTYEDDKTLQIKN